MKFRRMGRTGLWLSSLSYGSWITFKNQVDLTAAKNLLSIAYDHGVNFFDNAEAYAKGQSEVLMGKAIKSLKWTRDSYCVSSKVFWGGDLPTQKGLSRKHVFDACHAALKRLQVDYLDLYYCHRPDPNTPIDETVNAMTDLVRQGKVLYWGTSEWTKDQLLEAFRVAKENFLVPPSVEQPEYNIFHRQKVEDEFSELYTFGLGLTTWSPLASGILTGKYTHGIPKNSRATVKKFEWIKDRIQSENGKRVVAAAESLKNLAQEFGMTSSQMAIAWCLKNENVSTVILGARTKEQLLENIKADDCVQKLDKAVTDKIHRITNGIIF